MTTFTIPTLAQFKSWAATNKSLATAVYTTRSFAQAERIRVDDYTVPIFRRYNFQSAYGHGPVETPDDLYLAIDDPRTIDYYEECDAANRAHGFTGPIGHCPALIADYARIKAENALLSSGCVLFGMTDIPTMMDDRAHMLQLLLESCTLAR